MTEATNDAAVTILRNFQRMYVDHIIDRQAIPMTDPIFTLTDALYAATTDLLGPPDRESAKPSERSGEAPVGPSEGDTQ